MSVVVEDQEDQQNEQPEDDKEHNEEAEDEGAGYQLGSQSPGAMSQISGTTALTSHTTAELEEMDLVLVNFLPDLLDSSYKILDLLAPPDASEDIVESIVRELRVLGSTRAKLLKHAEGKFKVDREYYGTDVYIRTSFIQKKLFGSQEAEAEIPRPDAILHAANLATSVKDLLVVQKESLESSYNLLSILDTWFPESFVSFADTVQPDDDNKLDENFQMALEIRTQRTIVALMFHKSEEDWDPDQVLTQLFFNEPAQLILEN